MKVLIATDDDTFSVGLRDEYRRRGFEVDTGRAALLQREGAFDLVHCHWPEELTDWRASPSDAEAARAIEALAWWRERTQLVCSVHNLLPHAVRAGDARAAAYYRAFYEQMGHIGHFSAYSLRQVSEVFPTLPRGAHFVHGMNLFDHLKALSPGREAARRALGLQPDDYALLTFGALRTHGEVALLHRAIGRLKRVSPTVLSYARPPGWRSVGGAAARVRHKLWHMRTGARRHAWRLGDADTAAAFEAADALIVPRSGGHLNSGLLPLAMTFGTPIVAPDYGVYREHLAASQNELYAQGDAAGLAAAVERLAARPQGAVRASNLALAKDWGWGAVVDRILERTRPCGRTG